jgi:hypothetical protein
MMVRKVSLPRRTFLRGAGATLALPFLDAMVPALTAMAQTPARPPLRIGWIYFPNGVTVPDWTPAATGADYALTPTLAPLAPYRNDMLVVSGLAHRQAEAMGDGSGDHARASAVWLSGVRAKRTEGADVQAGTTVDQIAANALGRDTLLPSLELSLEDTFMIGNCDNGYSCAYSNAVSWRTDTTPLPGEANPRVVFERMFGDGGTSGDRLAQLRENRSILDAVNEEIGRLQRTLGAGDRTRIGQYLDAVREIEQRIQGAEARFGSGELPQLVRPVGIPETVDEHAKLMFDLQALALQADITRVFTFMIGREQSNTVFPASGTDEPHHPVSHHGLDPKKLEALSKINLYHVKLFTRFLDTLRATPEGDGNVLDHSILVYGSGLSDGDQHSHVDLPTLVVGRGDGRIKGGRHLRYQAYTPQNNLWVSLLNTVGVPIEKFGDNSGRIEIEPLSGV